MKTSKEYAAEREAYIQQLVAALQRIDAINDNPARFNKEINDVLDTVLRPELLRA